MVNITKRPRSDLSKVAKSQNILASSKPKAKSPVANEPSFYQIKTQSEEGTPTPINNLQSYSMFRANISDNLSDMDTSPKPASKGMLTNEEDENANRSSFGDEVINKSQHTGMSKRPNAMIKLQTDQ